MAPRKKSATSKAGGSAGKKKRVATAAVAGPVAAVAGGEVAKREPTDPPTTRSWKDRRTLDDWAQVAGASSRTLARLFERDLGMSFNQWRQRIRFHNALEALSRGESIARVAKQHGYNSASAFSAAFGKVMGASPSKAAIKT